MRRDIRQCQFMCCGHGIQVEFRFGSLQRPGTMGDVSAKKLSVACGEEAIALS